MNELEQAHKELISAYNDLDINLKREEIVKKFYNLTSFFQQIAVNKGLNPDLIIDTKLETIEISKASESEFLSAVFNYIIALEEIIGKSLDE